MTDLLTPEQVETAGDNGDLICPFCFEKDFDRYGLKYHLLRWCEPFDELAERENQS